MPGIKDLRNIYEKKGGAEIKKYLTGNVTITEKLDAHRFSFEKDAEGHFQFFKKNDNRPLTIVDRIISDLYEKAISHIESLPPMVKNNIPENLRFGFAYFPTNKPLRIEYKNVHPSKLVLTDITYRENDKVKKVYEDINFLNRWAKSFNVGEIPLIYQGKLDESAIEVFLNLADNDNRTGAFFTENISCVFGKTYTQNHIIEGIVIRSDYGLIQTKDPSFGIFQAAYEPQESRDFYDLTLLQIESFMHNDYKMPQCFSSISSDARYIELINDIFNSYVDNNRVDENMDPTFLQPKIIGSHGNLSRKFIRNPKTIEYINRAKIYEELYKVFLSSFRKKRKPHGLLTESFTDNFNNIIDNIQYVTQYTPVLENDEYDDGKDVEEFEDKLDAFKVISSIQLAFDHKKKEVKRGETPIIVMVGNFNPINNDHLRHITKMAADDKRIILCHVKQFRLEEPEKNFKMSDDIITKTLGRFASDNPEKIVGYMTVPFASISKIFGACRKLNYEPSNLLVEENCGPNYMSQLYLEDTVLGNRVGAVEDFQVMEFRNTKAYDVLRSIEDGNYKNFTEVTPTTIHGFWDVILSEWRKWAGTYE